MDPHASEHHYRRLRHRLSSESHHPWSALAGKTQPQLYPIEDSQVSFVCSLLTGQALDWVTAEGRRLAFPSFDYFLKIFHKVFEHSAGGKEPGEQLLALRQGRSTAVDYALSFRTLAAQSGWEDEPLKLLYHKRLTAELQSELTCRDEGKTLEQFIDLSIRIDNLMRAQRACQTLSLHVLCFPSSRAHIWLFRSSCPLY